MQRLALFDLDGTLIDRQQAFTTAVQHFTNAYNLGDEGVQWMHTHLSARAYPEHFADLRDHFGIPQTAEALWEAYVDLIASSVHCEPEILSGLEQLRSHGWKLGIATNGRTDIQYAKIASTGLDKRVDGICVSEEVGLRKPNQALLIETASRCEAQAREDGWMIGDSAPNDVGAGKAANLRTIWICHGQRWASDHTPPDLIFSFSVDAMTFLLMR